MPGGVPLLHGSSCSISQRSRAGRFRPASSQLLFRKRNAFGGKPVQVTGRAPGNGSGLPFGVEQPAIIQPHQHRIQRAGLQPRLGREVITMAPGAGVPEQDGKQGRGLVRASAVADHEVISLHI